MTGLSLHVAIHGSSTGLDARQHIDERRISTAVKGHRYSDYNKIDSSSAPLGRQMARLSHRSLSIQKLVLRIRELMSRYVA